MLFWTINRHIDNKKICGNSLDCSKISLKIRLDSFMLTLEVSWLCYHQKHSKIAISNTSTKYLKKNHFWMHVIIGSSCMLDWEDVKKIQNFPLCRLQDISVWSDKSPFGGLAKNRATALHKVTYIFMKKCFVWFILQGKLDTCMLKKFKIIWNCTTYKKKITPRKM